MQVAQCDAPVVFGAKNVGSERGGRRKVHIIGVCGNIVVGEKDSSPEFEIRREVSVSLKVPFQSEWIETYSVRRVCRLKDEEDGNGVEGIFEPSAEKPGEMLAREDPSVAQARAEGARTAAT